VSTKQAPDKEDAAGEELGDPPASGAAVYGVHAVRTHEITATDVVYRSQAAAESWAIHVSRYPDVLASGVTRYLLDSPGHRTPVALFVRGERQALPYVTDDQPVFIKGHGSASIHRR
jgi:hypothetical protein